MRRQREQLIMADSVAEISRMEAEEKAVEKRAKNKVHDDNAPAAAAKLEKNSRVVSTLTVKETISSLEVQGSPIVSRLWRAR